MKNYNPFKELAVRAGDQKRSVNWYQTQIQNLRGMNTNVNSMLRGGSGFGKDLRAQIVPGGLYLFQYDAKHQDTLPFWDKLPLVFPFRKVQGGFYGLNLHYLPPVLRAKFLDSLLEVTNNDRYDESTRFKLTYNLMQRAAKYKYFKPCIKHYLLEHMASRFALVQAPEWEIATFLPTADFNSQGKKYNINNVYEIGRAHV